MAQATGITESDLRRLLYDVVARSAAAAHTYCATVDRGYDGEDTPGHVCEVALGEIAASAEHQAAALLPAGRQAGLAPIAWAAQELSEWVSHLVRLERLGDDVCWAPITWLPRGDHPLGARCAEAAVGERLALLREELLEHGMLVEEDDVTRYVVA
jgi:hypothetical protein